MASGLLVKCLFALLPLTIGLTASPAVPAQQAQVSGLKVKFVDYQGPANFSAKALDKHSLQIRVNPRAERQPLLLGVELPASAQTTWAADVELVDSKGRPLPVRRSGIEWHKLLISVPPEHGTYVVVARIAAQPHSA
ncbi:MAG: hypothetical protein GXY83_20750 [Rhodopirellula sp.]|nr:hypothetical protein [Rhodopirellula sp.]